MLPVYNHPNNNNPVEDDRNNRSKYSNKLK